MPSRTKFPTVTSSLNIANTQCPLTTMSPIFARYSSGDCAPNRTWSFGNTQSQPMCASRNIRVSSFQTGLPSVSQPPSVTGISASWSAPASIVRWVSRCSSEMISQRATRSRASSSVSVPFARS